MFFKTAAYYSPEEGFSVWVKIVIGAIVGLVVGHWVPPGYAVWVLIGIILGALLDFTAARYFKKEKQSE
jgi:uncharacterized membrane protein YoaK (UPF0700 family)